eukprot:1253521-Amphidinium_carterae.1
MAAPGSLSDLWCEVEHGLPRLCHAPSLWPRRRSSSSDKRHRVVSLSCTAVRLPVRPIKIGAVAKHVDEVCQDLREFTNLFSGKPAHVCWYVDTCQNLHGRQAMIVKWTVDLSTVEVE